MATYANIAYAGSNVYVIGFSGKLLALNASNGQLRWEHVHQPGDRAGACLTTPVISDGILVYGGGAPDGITALLWGLDPATGQELWRVPIGCAGGISIRDGIAVMNSGLTLVAVDIRNGQILWRTAPMPDRKEPSPPVIDQGRAYTIHESGLVGFDLRSGQQEFFFPGNFPSYDIPVQLQIAGGKAYFTANLEQPPAAKNRRGFLYALDLSTKEIVLRHRVNRDKPHVETGPTTHFLVDSEFIYYENESLLVKLRH